MMCCLECLKKQQKINNLEDEVASLKNKLKYKERTRNEGAFGSSTPSSQKPHKKNSPEEKKKKGGGRKGHTGHGRSRIPKENADRVQGVEAKTEICPDCNEKLIEQCTRDRSVTDYEKGNLENIVYELQVVKCPCCKKVYSAEAPGVFAQSQYGNGLLTHAAIEHYLYGRTLGQLESQLGIGYSTLVQCMHKVAKRFESVPEELIKEYRLSPVKHADETGWRNDGANGYAWGFFTDNTSIFRLRGTRSAKVAQEVFGEKPLPGVLVVDRYNGYNKVPCSIQYCYAHLLRKVQDMEKEFPDNDEVKRFVESFSSVLVMAMKLKNLDITDKEFKRRAKDLKKKIKKIVNSEAKHMAVQTMQDVFREKEERLYHWAKDRRVPADNNKAERELRPLVIARKISFGSQSDRGARTREILMTVLNTLKKRTKDIYGEFRKTLDQLASNSELDPYKALFKPET